jgi:menaquinone-dependent protoporphyrinogen oxidase
MVKVLIAYGTLEGQTARIAEYMADVIRGLGSEAYPIDVDHSGGPDPGEFDAVIVGASVHLGKYENYVRRFVREHRDTLERLPSAFFSVSLTAHETSDEAGKELAGCVERFVQETGWRSSKVAHFAGALLYTRYGFFKRWIMKKIARDKGSPDLDTSRDYVYTDWDEVKRFAEEFLKATRDRLAA